MTAQEMAQTLEAATGAPATSLSPELQVLWLDKAGDWETAHDLAQNLPGASGAWLHAYLHRCEGDLGNASYWYHRANQSTPPEDLSTESEWRSLVSHFCRDHCR